MEVFIHTIKIKEFHLEISFQSTKRFLSIKEYEEVYQFFLSGKQLSLIDN